MALIRPLLEAAYLRGAESWARSTSAGRESAAFSADKLATYGDRLPGANADPIFHISGLTADGWMYSPGMRKLGKYGFESRAMKMAWHGWAGIPKDSSRVREQVEKYIAELNARPGHAPVTKVQLSGDSEGGLIARHALTYDEDLRKIVSGLTTNGTPHQGIRVFGSDRFTTLIQKCWLMPPGVRDLLVTSPVMTELNSKWNDALAGIVELDPEFRVNSIASRFGAKHDHDGLVPTHSAWLHGDPEHVTHYLTPGKHSLHLAFGNDHTDNFQTLLACYGSTDPAHGAAAQRSNAVWQTWAAQRKLQVAATVAAKGAPVIGQNVVTAPRG